MSRIVTLIIVFVITLTACNKVEEKETYTVSGTLHNFGDADKILLKEITELGLKTLDTAIVENNTFTFKGTVDTIDIKVLTIEKHNINIPFILSNAELTTTLYKDSTNLKVVGDKENEAFTALNTMINEQRNKIFKLSMQRRLANQEKDSVNIEKYKIAYDDYRKSVIEEEKTFFEGHKQYIAGVLILDRLIKGNVLSLEEEKEY